MGNGEPTTRQPATGTRAPKGFQRFNVWKVREMARKVKEQNIAVFGESGSGKTVLISSFYGATQEPTFTDKNHYLVIADDSGQGNRLRQSYLKMKNAAQAPEHNRFATTRYSFTLKPKKGDKDGHGEKQPFTSLRLVWHDYPGGWFEEDPSSDEEATRRVDTFTALLKSDIALVLVDGQKLLEYAGEEEKYLKSMLWGLRSGLEKLRDDILVDNTPLEEFPRIWLIALSKADLHPTLNAQTFKDLVVEKAANDVTALRDTLRSFVQTPEALSLGEDFMLLSSAKFETDRIDVDQRVGLDLILPVTCMLPLERIKLWATDGLPMKALFALVGNAEEFANLLLNVQPLLQMLLVKIPGVGPLLGQAIVPLLVNVVNLSEERLRKIRDQALENGEYLRAILAQFRLDLDQGVRDKLLVKNPR